jgi:hypothetical protein
MPRYSVSLVLVLALMVATTGCAERTETEPLPPTPVAEQDAVLALLRDLDRSVLDAAFDRLEIMPHVYTERLVQVDASGRPVATRIRTRQVEGGAARTVADETTGEFDLGVFGRFASPDDIDHLPTNPVPLILPMEPPYLGPRGREAYHFAFAPDTLIAGRTMRVVHVRARPGEGDDQELREAIMVVDPATNALVGVRVQRRQQSPMFGEESELTVFLEPGPDGTWLPASSRYALALRAPMTATRRFRLERVYEVG